MQESFNTILKSVPWYKRALLWILVFLQFYPVFFVFMPISMRVVISFMGIGLWLLKVLSYYLPRHNTLWVKKRFLWIFIPLFFIMIISIISVNYNKTNDQTFVYYFQTPLLMLSSAYFTLTIFKSFYQNKLSFQLIAYYCVGVVFFQLCLGIAMFFNSGLRDFLLSRTKEGIEQLNNREAGRFLGFGSFFMNLGVANGVGLMLCAVLLKNSKIYFLSIWGKVKLSFILIFVGVLGMFQARTTLFCDVIMLAFMSFSTPSLNFSMMKNGILRVFNIVLIAAFLLIAVFALFPEFINSNNAMMDYGFEMFESASKGKGLKTKSSNVLLGMLQKWPETTKTWLIGDGYYDGFYMSTDVGYARLIFYFGIFGMVIYYVYAMAIVWCSLYKITKQSVAFCIYFSMMVLLINLKSFTEYTHYVGLFFMLKLLYPELVNKKAQVFSEIKKVNTSLVNVIKKPALPLS